MTQHPKIKFIQEKSSQFNISFFISATHHFNERVLSSLNEVIFVRHPSRNSTGTSRTQVAVQVVLREFVVSVLQFDDVPAILARQLYSLPTV